MPVPSANRSSRSLDALNFLLADVRGAFGPYLNVFLVTQQHWSQSRVGLVTMIGGLIGLAVQTPIGAGIDGTRAKRGVVVAAMAVAMPETRPSAPRPSGDIPSKPLPTGT